MCIVTFTLQHSDTMLVISNELSGTQMFTKCLCYTTPLTLPQLNITFTSGYYQYILEKPHLFQTGEIFIKI